MEVVETQRNSIPPDVGLKGANMIAFPHAKINLGLRILHRRPDGFHSIETLLCPVGICDALEVIPSAGKSTILTTAGLPIPDDGHPNICLRALGALKNHVAPRIIPPLHIHIHKAIPPGSGLGGGSSNAAHLLAMLNEMFELMLSPATLSQLAASLGSDCPFFLQKTSTMATGRGEILQPVELPALDEYQVAVVVPPIHVSTAWVYEQARPSGQNLFASTPQAPPPLHLWREHLVNDLEPQVVRLHPIIGQIKQTMLRLGAIHAAMSGSGSAVFGIFPKASAASAGDALKGVFPHCTHFQPKCGT